LAEVDVTTYSFRQIYLPYAIVVLKDGSHLVVNRRYKPLGISANDWIDYDTHPTRRKIKGLTDAKAEKVGLKVSKSEGGSDTIYYLYNDGTNPEDSSANKQRYDAIITKLLALQTDTV
jgi:hypothetical protein